MAVLVALALVIGFSAAAALVLVAAGSAERAVTLAGVERRRDHLRRIGEAVYEVRRGGCGSC